MSSGQGSPLGHVCAPSRAVFEEKLMLKMLIAVDGSEHARRAVEAAARLASQLQDVEVVLLNVGDALVYYGELPPFDYEAVERAQRAHQERLLEEALVHAHACGLRKASTQSALGVAATEIVRVAEERGVDQIVMGTHGKGALGSLFLGSVAQRVVHLAKVPVLLVK
jgi:nucleotide-binding universal stress UspA family protein